MTICETRVKPFDVVIKNRMANMTSVDCATQLVDEAVGRRKRVTLKKDDDHQKKKLLYQRTVRKDNLKTNIILLWLLKLFASFTVWSIILLFVLLLTFNS